MQEQQMELEQKCSVLQDNNNEFLQSYEHMKAERDQVGILNGTVVLTAL
jgi:hypothetical protein